MTTEERLAALESRLRAAEDHLAILNLLNSYGPLVDSATAKEAGELWVAGGGYNFGVNEGGTKRLEAPDEVAGMYGWQGHLDLVNTGCAHLTATPKTPLPSGAGSSHLAGRAAAGNKTDEAGAAPSRRPVAVVGSASAHQTVSLDGAGAAACRVPPPPLFMGGPRSRSPRPTPVLHAR